MKNYATTGARVDLLASIAAAPFFEHFTADFKATAAESVPTREKDGWLLLKSMPWSRRRRRTLFQSEDWNLHLFSGPTGKNNGSTTAAKLSSVEATGPKVDVDLRNSNLMDLARPSGIYKVTRTEGDSPAQNGAAEQAVKYVKSRTRILLSSAQELTGRPAKEVKTWWPLAAETAVNRQRALAFGQEKISPAGFGNRVFVKRKRYGVDAKDLEPKWGPAVYLGPARDVPGGHVVLTEDNHLWNTCNVRQLPDIPMEPDPSTQVTRRRILGKRPPVSLIPLKALKVPSLLKMDSGDSKDLPVEFTPVTEIKSVAKLEYLPSCDMMKPLAQVSYEKQWYALEDCFAILEDTPFKKPNKTRVTEAWGDPGPDVEGSIVPTENRVVKFNPRKLHKSLPWSGTKWTVIAYVNRGFARLPESNVQELRDGGFLIPQREDVTLRQLRLQDEHDEFDYCNTSDEEELVLMGRAVTEDELVLLHSALDEEEKVEVRVDSSEFEEETQAIAQANAKAMMRCARLEAVAAEEFQGNEVSDVMEWFRLCRMVEGDEQHGIEEVLRNLQAPLQVVYTMSLTEVKENVDAWKDAIKKEVDALISCGALVRMEPTEEDRLRRGNRLVVLPAKGVFTVKPPDSVEGPSGVQVIESEDQACNVVGDAVTKSADQVVSTKGVHAAKSADQVVSTEGVHSAKSADQVVSTEGVHAAKSADQVVSTEGVHLKSADQVVSHDMEKVSGELGGQTRSSPTGKWFKRKARLVICGNYEKHIAEDLYAGGCQTESLRVMISYASGFPGWDAAVTDIRNAFLLAPMATDAVYGLKFPKARSGMRYIG
eukprot:s10784_g1.t1